MGKIEFKLTTGHQLSDFSGEGVPDIGQFQKKDLSLLKRLVRIGVFTTYRDNWLHNFVSPVKTFYVLNTEECE